MKTTDKSPSPKKHAYALMLTVMLTGVTLLVLAATLRLTSGECRLTSRHNLYASAVAAAEGGTERVLAQMERDFLNQAVSTDLSTYSGLTPNQSGWPIQYQYSDGRGNLDKTRVTSNGSTTATNLPSWTVLNTSYKGLFGMVTPYAVSSRATTLNQMEQVSATVSQDFQLALIPVFQFAIFYNMDLEINPGPNMDITGKVHSNADLYTAPGATLRYLSDVTFVGNYYRHRHPDDPSQNVGNNPQFIGDPTGPKSASSMSLPVGTNNTPGAITAILDLPPFGEDPNTALGKLRFFNLADIIVSNSASGVVTVKSGKWNNFAPILPNTTNSVGGVSTPAYTYITTSNFYDYREKKTVTATQFDVAKFKTWVADTTAAGGSALNNLAKFNMNHELSSIYVFDSRPQTATSLTAVRVMNGSSLPNNGLTVATPLPLYVWGHFNLNNGSTTAGNKDTSMTKPAALIGDSITVLSAKYKDSYAPTAGVTSRSAENTTVNAAFLSGIVTTKQVGGVKHYSGGVENFPRFLENWGSTSTLTYNGSMVVMFPSRYATNFWIDPGTGSANYYTAPTRKWAFDVNFLTQKGIPPMTPSVRKLIRGTWAAR